MPDVWHQEIESDFCDEHTPFYYHRSNGLIWVREGDINPAERGPFMDLRDAYEQCGEPALWINHGAH